MDDYRARGLTDGFLPETAFRHLEPTAIGALELGEPLAVRHPSPESWTPDCRDALVLVRLHEDPLAIVHIPGPLAELRADSLAAAVWRQAAAEIRHHCERF